MQILAIIVKLDIDCPVEISGLRFDGGGVKMEKKMSHQQVGGI